MRGAGKDMESGGRSIQRAVDHNDWERLLCEFSHKN